MWQGLIDSASGWSGPEIIISTSILLIAYGVSRFFMVLADRIGHRWASRTKSTLNNYVLQAVHFPIAHLIQLVGIKAAVGRYSFRGRGIADGVIFVLGLALVLHLLVKLLSGLLQWYSERLSRDSAGANLAREMIPLADKAGKVLIISIGLVVALENFNIEVKSVLVTLGVGSLAVGLALQDTLANMFGGFTIMIDRPFRIGDRIHLATGELGDVNLIGIRSTRILTPDGNVLIIPNAQLVKTMVTNQSLPDTRSRLQIDLRVAYGTDIQKAKGLVLQVVRRHRSVMHNPEPSVLLHSLGDFAVVLALVCYLSTYQERGQVLDALNCEILEEFDRAGIRMPFPTQSIVLQQS